MPRKGSTERNLIKFAGHTISNPNDFQDRVRFRNSALAHDTEVPEENDDSRASRTIPKGTAYTIAIGYKDTTEQCCAPEPGLPMVRYPDTPRPELDVQIQQPMRQGRFGLDGWQP